MADEDPRVRIGHCSPDAPNVDVHVDGDPAFEDVAFGDLSDYAMLSTGDHDIRVVPAGGGDAVIETSLELETGTAYTVLATGVLADIEPTVFIDEPGEPPSNRAHVRFIHASPDAPNVSIRVVDGPELFANVGFREASAYEAVDDGTYDLEVRPMGDDEAVLTLDDVSLPGGTAYSAVAIGQVSDGSLDAVLAEDAMASLPADD
jgi:hypothetical protein